MDRAVNVHFRGGVYFEVIAAVKYRIGEQRRPAHGHLLLHIRVDGRAAAGRRDRDFGQDDHIAAKHVAADHGIERVVRIVGINVVQRRGGHLLDSPRAQRNAAGVYVTAGEKTRRDGRRKGHGRLPSRLERRVHPGVKRRHHLKGPVFRHGLGGVAGLDQGGAAVAEPALGGRPAHQRPDQRKQQEAKKQDGHEGRSPLPAENMSSG